MEYRYATPIRLAEWRKWRAEIAARYLERGAPVPAEYAPGTLPPNWFGALYPASVDRTSRTPPTTNGEGLGGNISRPFRFVGFADEVKGVHINHTGWYGDEDGDTLYRGVVFQIPAKNGHPRYLAGVEWGESTRKGFDPGGGWIAIGRGDIYESAKDAARYANSMAKKAAELAYEENAAERERIRKEEEEAERQRKAKVAAALERILCAARNLCNGALPSDSPLYPMIDSLEEALKEYDSLRVTTSWSVNNVAC